MNGGKIMKRLMTAAALCAAALIGMGTGLGAADRSTIQAAEDSYGSSMAEEPVYSYTITEDGVIYGITDRYNAEIIGYTADIPADLIIPARAGKTSGYSWGLTVTKVCKEAFYKCTSIRSVTLPETVTEIGEAAFAFTTLETITIPNNDCVIYDDASTFTSGFAGGRTDAKYGNYFSGTIRAYSNSSALRYAWKYSYVYQEMREPSWTLNAAGTLTISGTGPMRDYGLIFMSREAPWHEMCEDVRAIVIGQGITTISEDAFEGCYNAVSVQIPDTVEQIGDFAFSGCSSLKTVELPDSVTKIGKRAFGDCSALESVKLSAGLKELPEGQEPGDIFYGFGVFSQCRELSSVTFSDSLENIGTFAFLGDGFTEVTVPATVKRIGCGAFAFCKELRSITILNPDCEIEWYAILNTTAEDGRETPLYSGVICGYEGSTAQTFAKEYGFTFRALGSAPPAIAAYDTGDVDGSASINASDAAQVLIAAAAVGAGRGDGLTAAQRKAADVNADTSINATDAAIVLQYAAAVGAGQKDVTIQDFVH